MNLNDHKIDENELPGWSSDADLWKSLSTLTQDLRWNKVPFNINSEVGVPGDSQGAYLIAAAAPAHGVRRIGAYTVLYVGSVTGAGTSLRARFKRHITNPAPRLRHFRRCFWTADFWFTKLRGEEQIYALESLLKLTFNPPCNVINPPGTSVIRAIIRDGVPLTRSTHASA